MYKVKFVTVANEALASYRYRIYGPIKGLTEIGHKAESSDVPSLTDDVAIFSKDFRAWERLALGWCKAHNIKTVFDVCDLHDNQHYDFMIKNADRVVASNAAIGMKINAKFGVTPAVVNDVCLDEVPAEVDSLSIPKIPDVVWFGHQSNADSIMPHIAGICKVAKLSIITNPFQALVDLAKEQGDRCSVMPWDLAAEQSALKNCDVVFLPTLDNEKHRMNGNNRLARAIMHGKPVIVGASPENEVFREELPGVYTHQDEPFVDALERLRSKVSEDKRMRREFMRSAILIKNKYSCKAIAEEWAKVIRGFFP